MTGANLFKEEEIKDLDLIVEEIGKHRDVRKDIESLEYFLRWCKREEEGKSTTPPDQRLIKWIHANIGLR